MSKIIATLSVIALVLIPGAVFAQNGTGQAAQGVQQQDRVQDPATHQNGSSPVGNQYQNAIQNQGEEPQIRAQEQEGTLSRLGSGVARQQMSMVGQKVDELINAPGFQGGIGEQIKDVAIAQRQSQGRVAAELDKIEGRNEIVKKILGPDYMAINSIQRQMAQNQQRIQTLRELAVQIQNEADQTMLQETIQAIVDQNTSLQQQIQTEEDTSSLFGWLMKMLSN